MSHFAPSNRALANVSDRYRPARRQHSGVVIVALVAILMVAATLFAGWAHVAVRDARQLRLRQYARQAARLAEAGSHRGYVRLRADPDYRGEQWNIPAAELSPSRDAVVRITIQSTDQQSGTIRVRATADFPADTLERSRRTVEIVVPRMEND